MHLGGAIAIAQGLQEARDRLKDVDQLPGYYSRAESRKERYSGLPDYICAQLPATNPRH